MINTPPTLTAGEKTDPLLEIFSGTTSGSVQPSRPLASPPPRFSDGIGANPTTVTAPVAVRPSPQVAEASAFNRSEMAAQIRQSFDNLVKASPIGVPLMARRTPSTGPGPSPFPPLRSPAVPPFSSSTGRLPLPPPVPSFGGFAFPRQVQQVQQPQARTMITPPSGGYNTNNTFIQQQQQQQQKQSPTLGLVDGGGSGDGDDNKNNMNNARAAGPPSTSRPPASAASQDISRKANMLGSGSGGGVGAGRKRELASLLASSPAVHHHIGTTPLPTTMPVSGGDRPPGSEDDLTFEVTRFGRPRVAPLAYWSSERLVVGTKAAGAQGIDKGSASGDLLASAGTITKKSGVKKNAEAPVAAKRGGRSRGRTAAGATTTTTSTRDGSRGKAAVTIDDDDDDISLPAPGSGIASIALAAGAKASAAAAAAKKKKTMLTTTAATTAAELPEPAARPISASPLPAIINTTTTTPTSVSNNKTLPEVKGVPATTLAALAATPPAQRPRRCGECISCLNPSRKQACLTLRALGANPPLSRVSHKKKQQAAAAGASAKKVSGKTTTTTAARKRSPSPPIAAKAAALPQDSEETITEKQPIKKKRTLNRSKRKAETSIDTGATGAGGGGGPVRRSTRQRSASVEVTANYREPSTVMDTVTKGNASVGPPSSRNTINKIALAAGGAGGGTAGAAVVVDPASIWTAEQVAALHRGWLKVAPDAKNFWQKVAAMVPGRSANECFNKIYEKHPTPPAKKPAGGGGKKLLAAVRAGSVDTTTTEPLKVGATSKQAVQNAARKIARQQQRLQQRAEEGAGGGSGKELLAAEPSEEQQHRDKYIDQILRKRRGRALGMAPHRAVNPSGNTAGASGAGGKGAGGGGFRAGASGVAREVTAALAAAREDEPDRDSEEESDYYWSDAE